MISLDELRPLSVGFYESGLPLLGDYSLVEKMLSRKRDVVAVCPPAILQAMLLQSERLLLSIYRNSAQSADVHAAQFSEASQLNLEFNVVHSWLEQHLPMDGMRDWGWPLREGWRRVQRYYDLLWQDVYDSHEAWAKMEGKTPDVSDEVYHQLLFEVAEVLEALEAEWWPCRGTLIALLRHGARSGPLSSGKVDVVDTDIDLMVGVQSEEDFDQLGRSVEARLLQRGWDRCWTKSSAESGLPEQFAMRRDLLYCMRRDPYMMLDVTSYVTGVQPVVPYVFVHRLCESMLAPGGSGSTGSLPALPAGRRLGSFCRVAEVGPLRQNRGILNRDSLYPLRKCRALDRTVPCPSKPLDTLLAMSHSGLSAKCIALPDTRGRSEDHFTRQLSEEGLDSEDVYILQARAQHLDSQGFQSMLPYFANCSLEKPKALQEFSPLRARRPPSQFRFLHSQELVTFFAKLLYRWERKACFSASSMPKPPALEISRNSKPGSSGGSAPGLANPCA